MAEFANQRPGIPAAVGFGPDSLHFRDAMSRIAATVHIVATDGPAGLGGITATAVTSITLEPAMMLVCVNRRAASTMRMIENGVFCINALSPAHEALADIFAGRTDQHLAGRFTNGEWTKLSTGSPVLLSAVASFDCRLAEVKEVATHFIMIGVVEGVAYGSEGESLAYVHRKYRTL